MPDLTTAADIDHVCHPTCWTDARHDHYTLDDLAADIAEGGIVDTVRTLAAAAADHRTDVAWLFA